MPPKKGNEKVVKKVDAKKAVDDKTFGMKNKKGGAAQRQIKQIKTQAENAGTVEQKRKQAELAQRKKEKEAAEAAKRELDAMMNRPAQIQKVPFGVDPKTVVCIFHKKGDCEKGRKCKFSHDLEMERKTEKKSMYQDTREDEEEKKKKETSADWDEEKLRSVVLSKKGNQRTTTDKVCKYFIQAIEEGKYGWFWICPNGADKCMYKHALPPGFVLKTKEQRAAEKALLDKSPLKTLTLEEFLESERHKLTGKLTPVTPETFAEWKKKRLDKKAAEEQARKAKEATGRALFESGNWRTIEDEDISDDEEDTDAFNLEKLRKETEAIRQRKEEERLAKEFGMPLPTQDGQTDVGPSEESADADENGESSGTAEASGSGEATAAT